MTARKTTPSSTDEPGERRQTPTERYHELALSAASRAPVPPEHTLGLVRNAAGNVQVELTVRGHDLAELVDVGPKAFDRICGMYPRVDVPSKAKSTGGAS